MCGSSTIAVALFAPHWRTVWRRISSAFAWIVWSIVRKTLCPSRSGVWLTTSIARPNGSLTIVSLPGVPESFLSSWSSRPARPWLSTPAKPSTCDATVPCG